MATGKSHQLRFTSRCSLQTVVLEFEIKAFGTERFPYSRPWLRRPLVFRPGIREGNLPGQAGAGGDEPSRIGPLQFFVLFSACSKSPRYRIATRASSVSISFLVSAKDEVPILVADFRAGLFPAGAPGM
jgi:hypothetical protein